MKKLIVLQTRFTLINKHIDKNAWRIGRESDLNETIKLLLDEDRLNVRSNIFFNHTLPSIDRAVRMGHNIIHTVLHYSGLPTWLLDSIELAKEKYQWFIPFSFSYEDQCDSYAVIHKTVSEWGDKRCKLRDFCFAGVRLDDDDIIGKCYFEKLSKYIAPEYIGFAISFPKGIAALWENNNFIKFADFYEVKNAQGIAQINFFEASVNKIKSPHYLVPGSHPTVDQRVPTILDSIGEATYIRSFHSSNDIFVSRQELEKQYLERIFNKTMEFDGLVNSTF